MHSSPRSGLLLTLLLTVMPVLPIRGETSSSAIEQAAQEWLTLESNRLAAASEQSGRATQLLQEKGMVSAASGQTGSSRLFPTIPDFAANPWVKGLFSIQKYATITPSFTKLSNGKDPDSGDTLALAYAFLHPQSPSRGDVRAVVPLLTLLNKTWCIDKENPWGEYKALIAYAALKAAYPNLVPPAAKTAWETEIRRRGEKELQKQAALFDQSYMFKSWLNSDVRDVLTTGMRGPALGDPKYTDWMSRAVRIMYPTLQPDGATNYTSYQNEAWTYHNVAIESMAWWWLITGDTAARDYVIGSAQYYPLNTQRFVGEDYTSPEQKHYYNALKCTWAFPGYMARDPHAVAAALPGGADLLNAFLYDPTLRQVRLPDNYTVFDRNLIGPRGKYGNMDFAFSTRDFSYYPGKKGPGTKNPGRGFGVTTILGMRVMYSPEQQVELKSAVPMNAAVERIMNHVSFGGKEYNKGQDLNASASMAGAVAAVSCDYMTSGRIRQHEAWTALPFSNLQEWIVTGERAVGLMKITNTAPSPKTSSARLTSAFEFVSGRGPWGIRKEFLKKDATTYTYGDLRLRVISSSYPEILTSYADGGLTAGDRMRGILTLAPNPSQTNQVEEWCLVEIAPVWNAPATGIKPVNAGADLSGFLCSGEKNTLILIHNPTSSPKTATLELPPGYRGYSLHLGTDGSVDRDKYLNQTNHQHMKAADSGDKHLTLTSTKLSYSIPPHRQILVIGSNRPEDHQGSMKFYEDIFVKP